MKYLILAATVLVATTSNVYAQYIASTTKERVHQMMYRRAVVKIDDLTEMTAGSGFIVHEDSKGKYILTNAHVAEAGHRLKVDLYPHGSMESGKVEVLARDEKRDLALLRIASGNPTSVLELRRRRGHKLDAEPALLVGFPGEELKLEKIRVVEDDVLGGRFTGRFYHLKKRFGAGGSGSPVICTRGDKVYVVGVYQGYTGTSGVACYDFEQFLDYNGYSKILDEGTSEEEFMTLLNASLSIVVEELERNK